MSIDHYYRQYTPVCDCCGTRLPGGESYSGGYGGYSAPAGGYPAQLDPDSEFTELTTDDGDLPF